MPILLMTDAQILSFALSFHNDERKISKTIDPPEWRTRSRQAKPMGSPVKSSHTGDCAAPLRLRGTGPEN